MTIDHAMTVHALVLAGILFVLGLIGLLVRRNLLFVLMSSEVMFNAAGIVLVAGGARWEQPDGQVMFIFMLTLAASKVSVGLALLLQLYLKFKTLDVDAAGLMKG
jgi:NADH-quinone oxidoreductase subunit K